MKSSVRLDKIEDRISSGLQLRISLATSESKQPNVGLSKAVGPFPVPLNYKRLRRSCTRFSTIMNVTQVFSHEVTSVVDVARNYMLTRRTPLPLLSRE
jgi:hypothetical protein